MLMFLLTSFYFNVVWLIDTFNQAVNLSLADVTRIIWHNTRNKTWCKTPCSWQHIPGFYIRLDMWLGILIPQTTSGHYNYSPSRLRLRGYHVYSYTFLVYFIYFIFPGDSVRTRGEGMARVSDLYGLDCHSAPEAGPCKGHVPRWFFNESSATCEKFIYGGCLGNANNYHVEEQCISVCKDELFPRIGEEGWSGARLGFSTNHVLARALGALSHRRCASWTWT